MNLHAPSWWTAAARPAAADQGITRQYVHDAVRAIERVDLERGTRGQATVSIEFTVPDNVAIPLLQRLLPSSGWPQQDDQLAAKLMRLLHEHHRVDGAQ